MCSVCDRKNQKPNETIKRRRVSQLFSGSGEFSDEDEASSCYRFVVKIFCTSTSPDYSMPWQMQRQQVSTASGFIISNRRILTNAHAVAYQTSINILAHGSSKKYPGQIISVSHDCDLALLTVSDNEFWNPFNTSYLEFGEIPQLQDNVIVVGYPVGGENISVTAGVVSRIEIQPYSHSNMKLLSIQIDAAINSGNSGGPAFNCNKVIGVAFESLDQADNIGYIIPTIIIRSFLNDVEKFSIHRGFGDLGFSYEMLENKSFIQYLKLDDKIGNGLLITHCSPVYNSSTILRQMDVLLSINGNNIAHDGTVPFRGRERVSFEHIVSQISPDSTTNLEIFRNGQIIQLQCVMNRNMPLVPNHLYDKSAQYYIFGGLVFTVLSIPYMESEWGSKWSKKGPVPLVNEIFHGEKSDLESEVVILNQILSHKINDGYNNDYHNKIVISVNDSKVNNLKMLYNIVENCTEQYIKIELKTHIYIVLEVDLCRSYMNEILTTHNIPRQYHI